MKHTGNILLASRQRKEYSKNILIEIHSSPQRAHPGVQGPPVVVAPVAPRLQQVLPPSVVGQLVEDPGALEHVEGVDLGEVEAVLKSRAVLGELQHLASEVLTLIDPDPVGAGLRRQPTARGTSQKAHSPCLILFWQLIIPISAETGISFPFLMSNMTKLNSSNKDLTNSIKKAKERIKGRKERWGRWEGRRKGRDCHANPAM